MSTEIAVTSGGAVATKTEWDAEMIQTLKQTVAKGATDAEFFMFRQICESTGLNPFLKEIWCAVPMKNGQRNPYGQVLIMASRDGYLRVANEHPMFDGIQTRVERDEKNIPIKAVCTVWRKDRAHPTIAEAYFNEYYKPSYNDKPGIWDIYKSAMISKVAEVLALKRSFSINGVVTEEEIGEQEPRGSKEAAAEVATRKIAALKAGTPHQELEVTTADAQYINDEREAIQLEHIPEAERFDRNAPPSELEQKLADSIQQVDMKKMLEQFSGIKTKFQDLGAESEYYRILNTAGFEKSNQIRPLSAGRAIYKEMAARIIELKRDLA